MTIPEAVRQPAQQHGVGEREADPVDAEQRHRHAAHARARLQQRQPEQQRQRGNEHEQHLELVAVVGGQQQCSERHEAGQTHGMRAAVHRVQLVQAHAAEHEQAEREDQPALDHQEQRDGDRGHGDEHARAEVRALAALPRRRPGRRGRRPPTGRCARGICVPLAISVAATCHRLPKRRRRRENSASDCASASREKSGHSSSRKISSE